MPHGDPSRPSAYVNLGKVFESSVRSIVAQGRFDGLVQLNGTLLTMQNVTWNGAQGFSKAPTKILRDATGLAAGTFTQERNVTLAIVDDAGHMIPWHAPAAGFKLASYLLGRVHSLS